MTDNEIIKYLEQAIDKYNKNEIFVDNIRLDKLSLDIIKRQQAEIDGLRADLKRVCTERDAHICTNNFIKSEAIKEFADKLKNTYFIDSERLCCQVDKVLKEMVGNTE